jgi:hypothetical protein
VPLSRCGVVDADIAKLSRPASYKTELGRLVQLSLDELRDTYQDTWRDAWVAPASVVDLLHSVSLCSRRSG